MQTFVQAPDNEKFSPFVIQGDDWFRIVAVCHVENSDPREAFDPFEPLVHHIGVVCEYKTDTQPDAFGKVHESWHRDNELSSTQASYFAGIAERMLIEGTAYVEVPA